VKGRKSNETPAFPEGMLEAVVATDKRITKELVPAAQAIKKAVSFNEFQKLRREFPGMPLEELVKIWHSRVNLAGSDYTYSLLTHMRSLYADFAAVGWFRTRDDKHGEVQRIGIGPTTDERVSIARNLTAFRHRDVIKTLQVWANAIRPSLTKSACYGLWNKLRHRKRYQDFKKHIDSNREFF
jgi:hypothetical protein